MNILLMGPQGAGKGTVAGLLSQRYDIPHISSGEILRDEIRKGTVLGKMAQSFIDDGHMIPTETMIDIIYERLAMDDCTEGFLLDGFPRNKVQAEALDSIVDVETVLLLDIPDDLVPYRLAGRRICGKCQTAYSINPDGFPKPREEGRCDECDEILAVRKDDSDPSFIQTRIQTYHSQTEPIIPLYEQRGLLVRVDAAQPIDRVLHQVAEGIKR